VSRLAYVLLLLAGACGGAGHIPPPVAQLPPGGPPPRVIRTGGYAYTSERLPAVSTDGSRVAVAYETEDGGRGNPNFRLVVLDVASDRVVDDIPLLSVEESAGDPDGPVLDARVDAANGRLARGSWRAMAPVDPPPAEVRLAWQAAATKGCEFPAHVAQAWASPDGAVMLVKVSYAGGPGCQEPDSTLHVLPRSAGPTTPRGRRRPPAPAREGGKRAGLSPS
jgi:hypothetical protein